MGAALVLLAGSAIAGHSGMNLLAGALLLGAGVAAVLIVVISLSLTVHTGTFVGVVALGVAGVAMPAFLLVGLVFLPFFAYSCAVVTLDRRDVRLRWSGLPVCTPPDSLLAGGPTATCVLCQYDLTGLTTAVCPECGLIRSNPRT